MILKCGPLKLGDIVLYNEQNKGWLPAVIASFAKVEKGAPPELGLIVFVNGLHNPTFEVRSCRHFSTRKKTEHKHGFWLIFEEAEELVEEEQEDMEKVRRKMLGLDDIEAPEIPPLEEEQPASTEEPVSEESATEEKPKQKKAK